MTMIALILAVVAPVALGQNGAPSPASPPQFLTPPLHAPEQVAQTIGGHLVYTPVSGISSSSGTGATASATLSSVTQSVSTNTDVTQALDSYQGEPMLMSNATLLVGGYNSIFPGNCSAALANCAPGSAVSSDGVSWTNARLPLTVNGHAFLIGFDPSVAVDASNTFYYAYGVSDGSSSGTNAIAVASSPDGVDWTLRTPATFNKGGQFDDKYWIAADPRLNQAGTLYVGWDRNKGNNQTLFVAGSTDGGNSWTQPIKVNDGTSKFERVIYAFPAVSPRDGTVYMAWLDYAKNTVFVDQSTNGGLTWGKDVAAATTHVGFGKDIGCNGGRSMTPAPQMGIDGTGAIYLTYADQTSGGPTGNYDIFLVKSTDGGAHWSAPVKLNDDGGTTHQYNPALSVLPDTSGTVYVSWYDRRNDPNNCSTDVYATVSTDGGATFSANTRVTFTSSNYDGNANGPGDYSGNAPKPLSVTTSYPFWASHLLSDIGPQTGTAGGFEIYTSAVSH
jgi:hypothetical protein